MSQASQTIDILQHLAIFLFRILLRQHQIYLADMGTLGNGDVGSFVTWLERHLFPPHRRNFVHYLLQKLAVPIGLAGAVHSIRV